MTRSEFKILKQILREHGFHKNGDLWGTAMRLFFDIAEIDYEISNTPNDWNYRPGVFGNIIDIDNAFVDCGIEITEQLAHEYGNFLKRLTDYLEYKGLSY